LTENSLFDLNRRFIDAGIKKAREIGVKVSIAVVDSHGDLVILERMPGAGSLSPKIAMGKASASAIFMRPTAEFEPRIQQNSAFWSGVSSMTSGALLFGRGGVPLKRGGETVGAIGVSGATSEQDEMIAQSAASELDKAP
jgi:glc operon protein GlcG